MTAPTQLHALGALEQAAAVRKGEVGPVELVRHHLDRVERYDERFGAFLTVTSDAALAGAAAAQERCAEGTCPLCSAYRRRSRTWSTRPACARRTGPRPSRAMCRRPTPTA